ncbi:cholinesterase 2-like [Branchiostoma floridae x Branchiostoma belcheri]
MAPVTVLQVLTATLVVVSAADVTTPAGRVSGLELDVLGTKVNAFLGIPFAKPPTGDRRFKPAEALPPWNGVYNATRLPESCVQNVNADEEFYLWAINTNTSEDCLYLSVWQPDPKPTNASVMVWIHGGAFQTGSSTVPTYDGAYLAATEGVVVVGLQYRVSTLGFLYAGTEDAPGNAGLTDQVMALTWVKNNIAAFGGDPEKVTLFGESAGGISVAFHLVSPGSRDLFLRAIMQSGTALMTFGLDSKDVAYEKTLEIAGKVGCPTDQGKAKMVECLQGKDGQQLVSDSLLGFTAFYPVEDGTVITESPFVSYEKGNFKKADILLGSNENEGTYFFLENGAPGFSAYTESLITREQFLAGIWYTITGINDFAVDAVAFQYTDWQNLNSPSMHRDALDRLYSDYFFFCPDVMTGRGHVREGATAYMYRFAHRSSANPFLPWVGVFHGEELPFVFGLPLEPLFGFTEAEKNLTLRMMRHWANFARTGNPNSNNGTMWSPFRAGLADGRYLVLDTGVPRMLPGPSIENCAFWENYVFPLMNKTEALKEALKDKLKTGTSGAPAQHLAGIFQAIAVFCSLVSSRIL